MPTRKARRPLRWRGAETVAEIAKRLSEREQVATQSALASFPRYRAVAGEVIPLAEFQKTLRPGEAYYRMTVVGAEQKVDPPVPMRKLSRTLIGAAMAGLAADETTVAAAIARIDVRMSLFL